MATGREKSFKFYTNPLCPYAHRTWLAVVEKGINAQQIYIPLSGELKVLESRKKDPEQLVDKYPYFQLWVDEKKTTQQLLELKAWYKQHINPSGEVPTVEISGQIVPESEICSEFVDSSFPNEGTHLVPHDPYKAAKIRLLIKFFASGITNFYGLLRNQEPEKDTEFGDKIYAFCSQFFGHFYPAVDGPFFIGKEFSLGDIIAIPFFDRLIPVLKHYRGFTLIPGPESDQKFPWAARARTWWSAVVERESYKKTTIPPKNFLVVYEGYSHNSVEKDGEWAGRGASNTFGEK